MTGSGLAQRAVAGFVRARRRFGWLDHLARAVVRYDQADGGRLAAAVTYYSFFAAFSLALLGFAILGHLLDDPAMLRAVQAYLSQNLPSLDAQALREARGTAGLVAFIVLPVAGLFWVDSLRSSIRAIWRLPQYPGNFFIRQLIDLTILAGLGLLLAASLATAAGTEILLTWLLHDAADAAGPPGRWLLGTAGYVLGIGVNVLLAIAALTALPRLRMRLRRVLGPALFVAAGLELLKTVGRTYVQRTEANPAYQVVTAAVAVLVFLSLLNQFILFAAALTATSTRGPTTDLATTATPATTPQPTPTAGTTGAPSGDHAGGGDLGTSVVESRMMEPLEWVRQQGIVLQSARGPVPNLAEHIAGEPIRGSWWGHASGHQIFAALNRVLSSPDVIATRLINGRITLIHSRLWPALTRVAERFPEERLAAVDEEHTASGAHRTIEIPFPDWVPADDITAAKLLTVDDALAQLPACLR